MHHGKGFGDEPLCRRMLLHQLEELQRQRIALIVHLRDIAAAFQTEKHRKISETVRFSPRDFALGDLQADARATR